MLSGGSADRTGQPLAVLPLTDVAYSLRVNILIASQVWNFAPPAQNYARSRGADSFVKKASAFLTVSAPAIGRWQALLAFLGLKNLQDIAFEVERMVGREGGRMVARLHEKLQKARIAPGIMRRFAEHGEK